MLLVLTKALLHYSIALGTLLIFLRHFEGGGAYGRSHVSLSLAIAKVFIHYLMMFQSLLAELQYRCSSYSSIIASKVKRGYFEWRVIPYCSNISETTEASELNVGGYNLL